MKREGEGKGQGEERREGGGEGRVKREGEGRERGRKSWTGVQQIELQALQSLN